MGNSKIWSKGKVLDRGIYNIILTNTPYKQYGIGVWQDLKFNRFQIISAFHVVCIYGITYTNFIHRTYLNGTES